MASGVNKVILIGNLGADPEMRYTQNGSAVTNFRIAVSRSYLKDGKRQEETEWVPIIAWNKLGEFAAQYLAKGRKVFVEGRLQTRSWDGPDGQKKYRTEVVANEVNPLDHKDGGDAEGEIDVDDLPFD